MLTEEEILRYQQQIQLYEMGIAGQQKLKAASVIVIGAGGLGCAILPYLTAAGIGKIGIVDEDCVERHNLHRQILYNDRDLGKYKSEIAADKLRDLNPHVDICPFVVTVNPLNALHIIQNYDIVIDATDNAPARYAINDACKVLAKPWIYGSLNRFQGQVAVFQNPDFDYRSLFPSMEQPLSQNCSTVGILGPIVGVIGSIQALEAIKIILGIVPSLQNQLLVLNGDSWQTNVYKLGQGVSDITISREAIETMLAEGKEIEFIDLRLNPNLDDYPFSKDKIYVLSCQRGIKSSITANLLRKKYNLDNIYASSIGIGLRR